MQNQSKQMLIRAVAAGLATFAALTVLFGCIYTVDEKERGVILRNGALIGVAEPGLGFKLPFFDTVKFISTQNYTTIYEQLQAYSKDQQVASLRVSVSWHVEPGEVSKVYQSYGDLDTLVSRLISRTVPEQVENVFGQYNAISAVQQRALLVADVNRAVKGSVRGPVIIDNVQVENIDFSDAYERSIEERMKAEVAIQTRTQNLETERVQAQIIVTQAQAQADAQLAKAEADAKAIKLRGEAEAHAIRVKAQALASNQNLVELTKAERWDGKLPTTMLPNSTVPFLSK